MSFFHPDLKTQIYWRARAYRESGGNAVEDLTIVLKAFEDETRNTIANLEAKRQAMIRLSNDMEDTDEPV